VHCFDLGVLIITGHASGSVIQFPQKKRSFPAGKKELCKKKRRRRQSKAQNIKKDVFFLGGGQKKNKKTKSLVSIPTFEDPISLREERRLAGVERGRGPLQT